MQDLTLLKNLATENVLEAIPDGIRRLLFKLAVRTADADHLEIVRLFAESEAFRTAKKGAIAFINTYEDPEDDCIAIASLLLELGACIDGYFIIDDDSNETYLRSNPLLELSRINGSWPLFTLLMGHR